MASLSITQITMHYLITVLVTIILVVSFFIIQIITQYLIIMHLVMTMVSGSTGQIITPYLIIVHLVTFVMVYHLLFLIITS